MNSKRIRIERNTDVIKEEKNLDNEASLANIIWNELLPILNSITDTMKKILENVCGAQKFYPVMDNYCDDKSAEEISRRVEHMAKRTDNNIKKETQCKNDKCDGNGVFVELNEDKNETTQNLNPDLSGNFMYISMIKIMDDITSDGNKDESGNNKNET